MVILGLKIAPNSLQKVLKISLFLRNRKLESPVYKVFLRKFTESKSFRNKRVFSFFLPFFIVIILVFWYVF